jgi:hypothetical protein
MELHLKIIGWSFVILAIVHIIFPRYFDWKNELKQLSLINRQMMIVHTFFIALTVFLMGLLCLTSYNMLINSELGHRISFGFFVFWLARLVIQFWGYSSELWKGKSFETGMHILFSLFWTYVTIVFLLIFLNSLKHIGI